MSAVAVSCARYAPPVATHAWVKDLRTCQEQKNIHSATVTSLTGHTIGTHFLILQVSFSLTSVDFQLDEQNSYLLTYNTFIKIIYMFRALPCSSSGGLRRNCIYAASGIVTLCR